MCRAKRRSCFLSFCGGRKKQIPQFVRHDKEGMGLWEVFVSRHSGNKRVLSGV
jgi:hypothetical protein